MNRYTPVLATATTVAGLALLTGLLPAGSERAVASTLRCPSESIENPEGSAEDGARAENAPELTAARARQLLLAEREEGLQIAAASMNRLEDGATVTATISFPGRRTLKFGRDLVEKEGGGALALVHFGWPGASAFHSGTIVVRPERSTDEDLQGEYAADAAALAKSAERLLNDKQHASAATAAVRDARERQVAGSSAGIPMTGVTAEFARAADVKALASKHPQFVFSVSDSCGSAVYVPSVADVGDMARVAIDNAYAIDRDAEPLPAPTKQDSQ